VTDDTTFDGASPRAVEAPESVIGPASEGTDSSQDIRAGSGPSFPGAVMPAAVIVNGVKYVPPRAVQEDDIAQPVREIVRSYRRRWDADADYGLGHIVFGDYNANDHCIVWCLMELTDNSASYEHVWESVGQEKREQYIADTRTALAALLLLHDEDMREEVLRDR
jgi:hypothetical protein